MITAVIPAYNEAPRIQNVIAEALTFADEVLVLDDGSEDETALVSEKAGAFVIQLPHRGYVHALTCGFHAAKGDIIVTLDADGEHDPSEIPRMIAPIEKGEADLVLGSRRHIASISERLMRIVVNVRVDVRDHGSGFRALKRELAVSLKLKGKCTCGVFVLEAASKGAKIAEIPITLREVTKKRKRKLIHIVQIVYVLIEAVRF